LPLLLLTRRPGETIIIELPTGDHIQVTVLGIKGNQIRVGTDAPDDVVILREELLEPQES
jgi:carbon storage regulator